MKNIILIGAVILSITATSCRKERTCECKTTETEVRSTGATFVDNSSTKTTKEKQNKKVFKNQESCYSQSYTYTGSRNNGPGVYTYVTTVETSCEIN